MSNLIFTIPCLLYALSLFGDAKAGIDDQPRPDPITETSNPSTTTTPPAPITETTTPSTTTLTTAAPLQKISRSNQEPEIIIGVCVSVFGLISLLVTVGVVTKICNDKKRPKQYQDARDTSRF